MSGAGALPAGVQAPPARRRGLRAILRRRSAVAVLMCLPLLLVVGGLVIYPAFYAIYLSMLNKRMTRFVGLANYAYLLSRPAFQAVIRQSVIFAVAAVVLKAAIGFLLAHLLHNVPARRQRLLRGLLLIPWDPAGAVHARLVVAVRSELLGVQLGAEPA